MGTCVSDESGSGNAHFSERREKGIYFRERLWKRYAPDGTVTYAAACDIGTTTVVCHLLKWRNREKNHSIAQCRKCAENLWGGCHIADSGIRTDGNRAAAKCDRIADPGDVRGVM